MFLMLVLLAGLGFTTTASAQDVTCSDLVWSAAVLAENPNIADGCLDVRERDGQLVAVYRARVVRQSVNSTIIQWQLPDGSWSPAQRRYPQKGFMAHIGDQEVKVLDLPDKQEVNVYVPAGEVWSVPAAEAAPVAAAAAPVAAAAVVEPEPEPEPEPAMLPTTATQLPMLALLGGLLILLGGALGFARTRL
jgi:hypothetical protein